MKKYIKEDIQPINRVNYPNIEFKNGTDQDNLDTQLLSDIQSAAEKAKVNVSVTSAVSNHKTETSSGTVSRHSTGNAVDISMYNGYGWSSKEDATNKKILENMNFFVDQLKSMGYAENTESGQNKAVLWFGFSDGQHENHIHISTQPSSTSGSTTGTQLTQTSPGQNKSLSFFDWKPLEGLGQKMKQEYDKKKTQTESLVQNKPLIEEINRIKKLLK